jgi:hypothetical protein
MIGFLGGSDLMPRLVIGYGGALVVVAVVAFRGSAVAQGLMSFLGLMALARSLPIFFQTLEFWPTVPFILGGSLTLGFGVLGLMLDRFGPASSPDSPGL